MKAKSEFDSFFKSELKKQFRKSKFKDQNLLRKSLLYTLEAPSSYFRPKLSIAVTKSLGGNLKSIFPWAMAVEMIHCASLIQDDLPCMDDAILRRGKKANHIIFKEDMALLAGSTLFVEAFSLLLYPSLKSNQIKLLKLLVEKTGYRGMMSGQALDIRKKSKPSQKFLLKMFQLKTGALIEASVLGPAFLFSKTKTEEKALKQLGKSLGQAYQVADDLQDMAKPDAKLKKILEKLTEESLFSIHALKKTSELKKLILYNKKRGTS